MASQCPKCHHFVDEDLICCADIEFHWQCEQCRKRSRGFAIPFGKCEICGGNLVRVEKETPSASRLIALQEAFQIEIESHLFYRRLAKAVEDPQISDFFESLSEKEREHAGELDQKYHLHLGGEAFFDNGRPLPHPFFEDLCFFADTGDLSRLYNCAIALEQKTHDFFSRKGASLPPGRDRDLYLEFAAEEKEHIAILETERDRVFPLSRERLSVTDARSESHYDIPIEGNFIRATELNKIDLLSYDPALLNTATCRSAITYIDGEKGILLYRGYSIEQLAEKSHYLEVAYLLIHGELPTAGQLTTWEKEITTHTMVHENIKKFMDGFHYDAHPMGILVSTVAALATFYKDAKNINLPASRNLQKIRLIGKMITLAAYSYRHSMGLPYVLPDNSLSYAGNFLNMMYRRAEPKYLPNPVLEKALDVLLILHADHEQNASTNVMRCVGSSRIDPFTAASAAAATLYGPLHGGANEEVLVMLNEIGSRDRIADFLKKVVSGERKLMGFGHRIYKNYDPRAKIIKEMAHQVFEVTGSSPLLEIALELERIALEDDYFIKRKLYPNVDFYSGLIYQAMGFPVEIFPVLFAIARTSGWLAQWEEMLLDPEQKIARPRQIYTGSPHRDFVPMDQRKNFKGL